MSDTPGKMNVPCDAMGAHERRLHDRISDLEKQLAEKDKEIKHSWAAGARHESMCRSEEIKALKSEIELYLAEMSAAFDAGFYSAQELFHAYQVQGAEIERMRPVVDAAVEQAHNSVESFIAMAAIELAVEEYEKSKP